MVGSFLILIITWMIGLVITFYIIRFATKTDQQLIALQEIVEGQNEIISMLSGDKAEQVYSAEENQALCDADWFALSFYSRSNGEVKLIHDAVDVLVRKMKNANPDMHPKILSEKYDEKVRGLIENLPDEVIQDFKRAYYAAI